MLENFNSKQLSQVLDSVRQKHKSRRGDVPEIGKSVVDEVRTTLSQVEIKDLIIFQFDSKRLLNKVY